MMNFIRDVELSNHFCQDVKPKEMHVNLVPFLEKNTSLFMKVSLSSESAKGKVQRRVSSM
jgi:hypothetical protein